MPDTAAWSWRVTAYVLVSRVVAAGLRLILGRFVAGRYACAGAGGGRSGRRLPPVDEELLLALMCAEDHRFLHHAGSTSWPWPGPRGARRFMAVPRGPAPSSSSGAGPWPGLPPPPVPQAGRDGHGLPACRDFDKPAIAASICATPISVPACTALTRTGPYGPCPGRSGPGPGPRPWPPRLKYSQPFEPECGYAARIAAREGHVGRLRDSSGQSSWPPCGLRPGRAAPRARARTCPPRPAAVPGDSGIPRPRLAGGFVRQEAVDWALVRHFQPREWGGDPSLVDPDIVYALDRARHLLGAGRA